MLRCKACDANMGERPGDPELCGTCRAEVQKINQHFMRKHLAEEELLAYEARYARDNDDDMD